MRRKQVHYVQVLLLKERSIEKKLNVKADQIEMAICMYLLKY